jgi:hypothetical protein
MGGVFRSFSFFCVRERRTRRDPNFGNKIMLWKNNEAKDQKTRHNKVPEKTPKKMAKPKTNCPIRGKLSVTLDMCQNSCFPQFCHQ